MNEKRRKMDEYNRARRERRRAGMAYTEDELTMFKTLPTIDELKDALREVRTGSRAIIRLAALMDNLSLCEGRRVSTSRGKDCRGRTDGIKAYLRGDGYLYSRYSSLMRYKKLGRLLREASGVDIEFNLLWGLDPQCPTDDGEPFFEDEYDKLRSLYESINRMNFKQIIKTLGGDR